MSVLKILKYFVIRINEVYFLNCSGSYIYHHHNLSLVILGFSQYFLTWMITGQIMFGILLISNCHLQNYNLNIVEYQVN